MRIGIDISQVVYEKTGVATYVREMVRHIVRLYPENTYILFGSSLRRREEIRLFVEDIKKINSNVKSVILPFPPTLLDFFWNRMHVFPVTRFTGPIDIFWSSDWTQPPVSPCVGMTTIHDVSFLHFPKSFTSKMIAVQKRRLYWVKRECKLILCDSNATKRDVMELLHIPESKLRVVYPGYHA